jgi:hypothetical protein
MAKILKAANLPLTKPVQWETGLQGATAVLTAVAAEEEEEVSEAADEGATGNTAKPRPLC